MLHQGHNGRHTGAMRHSDMRHFEFFQCCNGLVDLVLNVPPLFIIPSSSERAKK